MKFIHILKKWHTSVPSSSAATFSCTILCTFVQFSPIDQNLFKHNFFSISLLFINLLQYTLLYTQYNVYKEFDTNWNEKAIKNTKNYILKEYSKKTFDRNNHVIRSIRGWEKGGEDWLDRLQLLLEFNMAFFWWASAVHCSKYQKKINTKSIKMHHLVHVLIKIFISVIFSLLLPFLIKNLDFKLNC